MNEIERKARELLAAEIGQHILLMGRRSGMTFMNNAALRAIIAALTPPEGYVLVPVIPDDAMYKAAAALGPDAFLAEQWAAMLAARPEVSP